MNITTHRDASEHEIYQLTHGDDEVIVASFGAQILSWTKSGVSIIFGNEGRAIVDGKTPYRGGAPICFPHFGKGTLLPLGTELKPMHGNARTSTWDRLSDGDEGQLVLRTSQPASEGYGPTDFSCQIEIGIGDSLTLDARIQNEGDHSAPFQFALHTYWATRQPEKAEIHGIGYRYLDNLAGMAESSEVDSALPHSTPIDRVYLDSQSEQELVTADYRIKISTEGCSGSVVWNPGPHHEMKDLGRPDFICLESGVIIPGKELAPGGLHSLQIKYHGSLVG